MDLPFLLGLAETEATATVLQLLQGERGAGKGEHNAA